MGPRCPLTSALVGPLLQALLGPSLGLVLGHSLQHLLDPSLGPGLGLPLASGPSLESSLRVSHGPSLKQFFILTLLFMIAGAILRAWTC